MISHLNDIPNGLITNKTPNNPKIKADHLKIPTLSFKNKIEKNDIKIGDIKKMAVASASGKTAIPAKKEIFATTRFTVHSRLPRPPSALSLVGLRASR